MGAVSSQICNPFAAKKRYVVLMSGLSGAGKTSIQCRMKFGQFPEKICSYVSCIMEEIEFDAFGMTLIDIGASEKWRAQHVKQRHDAKILIYVVDCTDADRMEESRSELHQHLSEETMKGVKLLVLVSKREIPNGISDEMIIDRLKLRSIEDREWHMISTSAKTGMGISD
ncbi:hypothetical protein PMAYCL1PPCAC_10959, partial [Pristionchus mayeri]